MKDSTYNLFMKSNWKKLRIWIPVTITLLLLVSLIVVLCNHNNLKSFYDPYIDPLVAIGTAIIALSLGFFQSKKNWEDQLPKRLTVHFIYNGKAVLSCYEAFLAGAGDVRAWSQQIGGQMAGVPYISFFPYINSSNPTITKSSFEKNKNNKSIDILLYEAIFYLKNDSFLDNKGNIVKPEITDKYVIWLDNNPDTPGNIEYYIDERPNKPYTITEAIKAYKVSNDNSNSSESTKA